MCGLDKDLLQQYIDNELEPLEKILLEEHLCSCRDCRRELNQLKVLDWDLKSMIEIEVPAELATMRKAVLANSFKEEHEQQNKYNTKEYLKLQQNTLRNSINFMQFLPGAKLVSNGVNTLNDNIKISAKKRAATFLSKIIDL